MILPRRLVVDASVVAKCYLPEADSDRANALMGSGITLLAPDLLVSELGNILWKWVQAGNLPPDDAESIASTFIATHTIQFHASLPLLDAAVHLGVGFQHPVYDMVYVSLALVEDIQFVTADGRLLRLVQGTELERSVIPLATLGLAPR